MRANFISAVCDELLANDTLRKSVPGTSLGQLCAHGDVPVMSLTIPANRGTIGTFPVRLLLIPVLPAAGTRCI